ncbi:MAG: (2Fe-2S) ferredoxin domain-containing protein [Candidatus Coatesbacteria bacterium]|nr:MAG: (2Fe-2S) ferredoxin domain-containing protein [Candidatus Coatesbacteria bacterium]
MAKLKIQDLKRIRDESRRTVLLREGTAKAKVTVHMGTCGIAAGAREIMDQILRLVEKHNLQDVMVTSSGCAGMCSHEPMMTVEYRYTAPVKYIDLNEEKVAKIFEKHILNGEPVPEYALGVGSESMY